MSVYSFATTTQGLNVKKEKEKKKRKEIASESHPKFQGLLIYLIVLCGNPTCVILVKSIIKILLETRKVIRSLLECSGVITNRSFLLPVATVGERIRRYV